MKEKDTGLVEEMNMVYIVTQINLYGRELLSPKR